MNAGKAYLSVGKESGSTFSATTAWRKKDMLINAQVLTSYVQWKKIVAVCALFP
jgi:hypothetical protein